MITSLNHHACFIAFHESSRQLNIWDLFFFICKDQGKMPCGLLNSDDIKTYFWRFLPYLETDTYDFNFRHWQENLKFLIHFLFKMFLLLVVVFLLLLLFVFLISSFAYFWKQLGTTWKTKYWFLHDIVDLLHLDLSKERAFYFVRVWFPLT